MNWRYSILLAIINFVVILQPLLAQQNKIDSLLKVLEEKNLTPHNKVLVLNQLARLYKTEQPQKVLKYANLALLIAKKQDDNNLIALSLNNIGEYYLDDGNYAKAMASFQAGNKAKSTVDSIKVSNLNKIGVVYYFQGKYPEALRYQEQALKILESKKTIKNIITKGQILSAISYIYLKQGRYSQALVYHFKALEVRKQSKNLNEVAKSYNSIGDFYQAQGSYQKALEYYKQSLRTSREAKSMKGIAIANSNLGKVYLELGNLEEALTYQRRALQLKKKLGITKEVALSYAVMANIYRQKEEYKKALFYLQRNILLYKELDNKVLLAKSYNEYGSLLMRQNKPSEALDKYVSAEAIIKFLPPSVLHLITYENIYQYYLQQKQADMFMRYFQKYQIIAQDNNIYNRKLERLQRQYEYQTQQTELDLLLKEKVLLQKNNQIKSLQIKRKNNLLFVFLIGSFSLSLLLLAFYLRYSAKQRMNNELAILNKELDSSQVELKSLNQVKNRFISILSHDLRKPLSSFISFMSLVEISNKEDLDSLQSVSKEMKLSVQDTLNLLDNLLNWSRSQTSSIKANPELVKVDMILRETLSVLSPAAQNKNINLSINIDDKPEIHIDPNMLRIIFNNLVSNAIKFTPKEGEIDICVIKVKDSVVISFQDTGVGLSQEEIARILSNQYLSKRGTQNEKGSGLGLWLCRDFVEQNQGTFDIESQPGIGSKFTIAFSKYSDETP